MKWKVLISSAHMQSRLDKYRELLEKNNIEVDVINRPQFVSESDLIGIIEPYDALVCSDDEVTADVLERAKNLKVISKWGVGLNSIDVEGARRRGIAVYNSPGAFSESVALMVFAYILRFARFAVEQDKSVRAGFWKHMPGLALSSKTLGIIGAGNVGQAIMKRALAFEMRVLLNDIKDVGFPLIDKKKLLSQSDFVVLAPDLNPTSFHLMKSEDFSLMKPTAFIFNISRGPVIDEKALVRALETRQIAGAGLDVFETEPLPSNSPLRGMENVLLTPHNAYNTAEAENFVHDNTINNLIEGLSKLKI